jgi:hypothetical protein
VLVPQWYYEYMKYIIALLALGFIGCGDNSTGGTDAAGNQLNLTADGQPIYTLEDHYSFRLNGIDAVVWGVDRAFGRANEDASIWDITEAIPCGIRMIVKKVGVSTNDYTMKIGASDQTREGCGQFRGNYTMTLTGAKTAEITWVGEDDETF